MEQRFFQYFAFILLIATLSEFLCFAEELDLNYEMEAADFYLLTYTKEVAGEENKPNKELKKYIGFFGEDLQKAENLDLLWYRSFEDVEKLFIIKMFMLLHQKFPLEKEISVTEKFPLFFGKSVPLNGWIKVWKKPGSPERILMEGKLKAKHIPIGKNTHEVEFSCKGEIDLLSKFVDTFSFTLKSKVAAKDLPKELQKILPMFQINWKHLPKYLQKENVAITGQGSVRLLKKKQEAPREMVDQAIAKGVEYLKNHLKNRDKKEALVQFRTGDTLAGKLALVLFALLKSDLVSVDDPLILAGMDDLLQKHQFLAMPKMKRMKNIKNAMVLPGMTYYDNYTPGLILMLGDLFLRRAANLPKERADAAKMKNRIKQTKDKMGLTLARILKAYKRSKSLKQPGWGGPDLSNTQYAILGLHAAGRAGLFTERNAAFKKTWKELLTLLLKKQLPGSKKIKVKDIFLVRKNNKTVAHPRVKPGGWTYQMNFQFFGNKKMAKIYASQMENFGTYSMTCTGIASLAIAMQYLDKAGLLRATVRQKSEIGILRGLAWMQKKYTVSHNTLSQHYYYCMYALERAGVIAHFRYIGERDWYRDGALALCVQQASSGRWGPHPLGDEIATAFTLLFLKRASSPVITYGSGETKTEGKKSDK